MAWKTYLIMYFNGQEKITEIVRKVEKIGFKSSLGPVDFEYIWENEPTKEQVLELCDILSEVLKNSGAIFNLDTHN